MTPAMPPVDQFLLQAIFAANVEPTEIAVFSIVDPDELELVGHMRPDASNQSVRDQAIAAFREIATQCLKVRRAGVIEVGPPTPESPGVQYCLVVPYRSRIGHGANLLCLIIRRSTSDAAARALTSMSDSLERVGLQTKRVLV